MQSWSMGLPSTMVKIARPAFVRRQSVSTKESLVWRLKWSRLSGLWPSCSIRPWGMRWPQIGQCLRKNGTLLGYNLPAMLLEPNASELGMFSPKSDIPPV
jgi:hypothetical protein